MLTDYDEAYQPGGPVEKDLVAEMVACRWRILRLRMMETALLDSEMQRELPSSETSTDPGYRMAFAFRRLIDEPRAMSLVSRHESRLHRIHERCHHTLLELQKNSPSVSAGASEPVTPAPIQPEPPPPAADVPAAAGNRRQPLPIVGHRSFRHIDTTSFRCSRQLKTA